MSEDYSIVVFFCEDHLFTCLKTPYPDHHFNCLPTLETRKCRIDYCTNQAVMRFIGYQVPQTTANIERYKYNCRSAEETLDEATDYLTKPGNALDRLTLFFFYKIRLSPLGGDVVPTNLCRSFASLVLSKLNIDPTRALHKSTVHEIMSYLKLYPPDFESK